MRQKHFYILSQYVLLGVGETYIVCKVIKIFMNAMKKNKKKTFIFALFPQKEWLPCFGKPPKQESHTLKGKR